MDNAEIERIGVEFTAACRRQRAAYNALMAAAPGQETETARAEYNRASELYRHASDRSLEAQRARTAQTLARWQST